MNWNRIKAGTTKIAATAMLCSLSMAGKADDLRSMTGGIGEAEQARMEQAADDYSLALTFSARSGHYLANVDVKVKDRNGDIVYSKDSTGPIVLVDLPPGRYTVEGVHEGRMQGHTFDIGASGTRSVTLSWKDQDSSGA
jgi:hypothetical protein